MDPSSDRYDARFEDRVDPELDEANSEGWETATEHGTGDEVESQL